MSGLWTPSGASSHAGTDPVAGGSASGEPASEGSASEEDVSEEDVANELRRVRAELASTAVADLVANHAIELWQLAVLHLTPEPGARVRLDETSLAIDAMAAIVEGVGDRLGTNVGPLRDALSQLRLAFVQVSGAAPDT